MQNILGFLDAHGTAVVVIIGILTVGGILFTLIGILLSHETGRLHLFEDHRWKGVTISCLSSKSWKVLWTNPLVPLPIRFRYWKIRNESNATRGKVSLAVDYRDKEGNAVATERIDILDLAPGETRRFMPNGLKGAFYGYEIRLPEEDQQDEGPDR